MLQDMPDKRTVRNFLSYMGLRSLDVAKHVDVQKFEPDPST